MQYIVYCQEYERTVIYRLGLMLPAGVQGPGIFFILPCIDDFETIDMRTKTFKVPPQEVGLFYLTSFRVILGLEFSLLLLSIRESAI